jgi:predicted RecA/RadA family phage recombinase
MQNFIQEGRTLYITAPVGGTVSGQPVVTGKIFSIASETVPAGVTTAVWRKGAYTLSKTNAQAWNQGDSLYWDNVNDVVTNVNTGTLLAIGYAFAAAANPSSTGQVLLAQAAS